MDELQFWVGLAEGEDPANGANLRRFWERCVSYLPADRAKLCHLRGESLRAVLHNWKEQWSSGDQVPPDWQKGWSQLSGEDQKSIRAHRRREDTGSLDISSEARSMLRSLRVIVVKQGEEWIIGNYYFWVFFFKGRGRVRRLISEHQVLPGELVRVVCECLRTGAHRGIIAGAVSQLLVVVFLLASMHLGLVDPYRSVEFTPLSIFLSSFVFGIGAATWVLLEMVHGKPTDLKQDIPILLLHSAPAGLLVLFFFALLLDFGQQILTMWIMVLLLLVAAISVRSLFLPVRKSLRSEWDWLKFLVSVSFLVAGVSLLQRWLLHGALPNGFAVLWVVEWTGLMALTYVILRLWWLRLRHKGTQAPSSPELPGRSSHVEDLLARVVNILLPDVRVEDASVTFVIVLCLLLGHLLWLRLQVAPRVAVCGEEDILVEAVLPPFLSTEDEGEVVLSLENRSGSTRTLLVEASDDAISTALWAEDSKIVGRNLVVVVPERGRVTRSATLKVLPLSRLDDIIFDINVTIISEETEQHECALKIPVLSRVLPRVHFVSRTVLGWLLNLAWGISTVVTTGFLAMRGDVDLRSEREEP